LTATSSAVAPLVVHQDTLLNAMEHELTGNRYILATNDAGCIVGVVSGKQILKRLRVSNDRERTRWMGMPLNSLIKAIFPANSSTAISLSDSDIECVAIAENDSLVGIAIQDDLFMSWQRLAPILSGAAVDPLTGLMNRLAYERRLVEEWHRAKRTGTSIAVIVIDLDNFKQINDEHGHQGGDEVLRSVASALDMALRSYDTVARYGGDEFIALCLGCAPGEIEIPIRRIRQSIDSTSVEFGKVILSASASIGAAVRHDNFGQTEPTDLFTAADDCMYYAKRSAAAAYCIEFGEACQDGRTPIFAEDDLGKAEPSPTVDSTFSR
jgi:diguanylate cyclase (GGDEF)-like protein